MFFFTVFCLLLVTFFIFNYKYRYWKSLNVPYETPFLMFGNLYDVIIRKEHLFEKVRKIYNNFSTPYVGIFFFCKPALLVRSPELLKNILVKDFEKFINRDLAKNLTVDPLAFYTLFFMKNEEWRDMRSKFSSAFTPFQIKGMFNLMQERTETFSSYLKKYNQETVEVKHLMKKLSTDITASCALGVTIDCYTNEDSKLFKMAGKLMDPKSFVRSISIFSYFFMHPLVNLFNFTFADRSATDYLGATFQNTITERRKNENGRKDFIDAVIKIEQKHEVISDNKKYDDTAMIAQALTFFGAGTDTTAIILAFTLYELSKAPTIQEQLRNSVREAFQRNEITYETVQNIKYLDMVVNETLRKYPLAGILLRTAKEDYFVEETGLTIQKNTTILVPVSGLHYDPKYFPDPYKYNPERFSEDNVGKIPRYSFLPFGDGPRHCIGKKFAMAVIKMSLANIIKDFKFETTAQTVTSLDFDPASTTFVQNRGGLYLKMYHVY